MSSNPGGGAEHLAAMVVTAAQESAAFGNREGPKHSDEVKDLFQAMRQESNPEERKLCQRMFGILYGRNAKKNCRIDWMTLHRKV